MRIVVRHPDVRAAREAQALLAAAGVAASAAAGPYRPAPDGEDISIWADQNAAQAAEARGGALGPLACLSAHALVAPPGIGLQASVFDGAIALDAPSSLLAAQIDAHVRLAVAEEECERRAASASALGATPPHRSEQRALKALFIGAPVPAYLALRHAFEAQGGDVAAAFSSFAGFDRLHDERFDAVMLNGASDASTALSLCAAMRRNAMLYHLPTLVVTAAGDERTGAAAIERGAAATVAANAELEASLGWLFAAIRLERRRRLAEQRLAALRDIMGEPRTGLFRRDAFETHVGRLALDHHASGRPLAMALLRVLPAHGARAPSAEAWRKGFGEIASLACRLARAADSSAAVRSDLIAVALPAADRRAAQRCAERIAAVAECTAFVSAEESGGPLVLEQSAVELQPGESGAAFLARALRDFDAGHAVA